MELQDYNSCGTFGWMHTWHLFISQPNTDCQASSCNFCKVFKSFQIYLKSFCFLQIIEGLKSYWKLNSHWNNTRSSLNVVRSKLSNRFFCCVLQCHDHQNQRPVKHRKQHTRFLWRHSLWNLFLLNFSFVKVFQLKVFITL